MKLIRVIAKIPNLVPILLDIPKTYVPQQIQSIHTLLKQLEGTNKIFVTMTGNNIENKANLELAKDIIETYAVVNKAA